MLLGLVIGVVVVATVVEVILKRRDRRRRPFLGWDGALHRPGIGYEDSRVQPTKERSAERWAELKRAAEDRGE